MKNILIDGHEAHDINKQIRKVIKGLGNPEPPLDLDEVLDLLNLDRGYYSSDDESAIQEVVSRDYFRQCSVVWLPQSRPCQHLYMIYCR